MVTISERWGNFWERIRESPARIPGRVVIPRDHVDEGEKLGIAFQPNEHYFEVNVNELYLTYSREWFSTYDPMVLVVSEFTYDQEVEAVPYIVGPTILEKKVGQKMPQGMICSDTRVAGLHPFRGGRVALTLVLYRIRRESYARKLLKIVESAASAFDFSTAVASYLKMADVVLDGVEALIGSEDVKPLIGISKQFRPEDLQPDYFALIDMPEEELNAYEMWVRDRRLAYGKSLSDAKPFRDAEYVLYSITQSPKRTDVSTLPFYPQWERVVEEASKPTPANWESAKANMLSLYQTMMLSPDLTRKHSQELTQEYIAEMKEIYKRAVEVAELGPKELTELDKIRKQSLDILKM